MLTLEKPLYMVLSVMRINLIVVYCPKVTRVTNFEKEKKRPGRRYQVVGIPGK